jgi:hypothetical protein
LLSSLGAHFRQFYQWAFPMTVSIYIFLCKVTFRTEFSMGTEKVEEGFRRLNNVLTEAFMLTVNECVTPKVQVPYVCLKVWAALLFCAARVGRTRRSTDNYGDGGQFTMMIFLPACRDRALYGRSVRASTGDKRRRRSVRFHGGARDRHEEPRYSID